MNPRERAISGLWGAVIGDALGVPVEFKSREQLDANPVIGMRGMGSHQQPMGTWSDDSSMMFCLTESLCGDKFDTADIGGRFVRWYTKAEWTPHGEVFDIGLTTASALRRLASGGIAAENAGETDEFSNGNGALMRTLPLAIAYSRLPVAEFADRIERVAAITHGHAISKMSCVYYCLLLRRVMGGQPLEEAYHGANQEFTQHYSGRPEAKYLVKFQRLTDGVIGDYERRLIDSSGYTVATLEAAIWCTLRAASYEIAVLEAVNLGNDTDTTGMVAGGLAGMAFGIGTPEVRSWAKHIARRSEIQSLFARFIDKVLQRELRDTLYEKMSMDPGKLRPANGDGPSTTLPAHTRYNPMTLNVVRGNIVTQKVDAIVNAANTSLLGGGGVDGAIHRAAGPKLVAECRMLNGCRTGDAKITAGYNLVAKHVIHTVGPVWNGGKSNEPDKLRSCYQRSMEVAEQNAVKTIAFPAISTGIYCFPHEEAARIAISTIQAYVKQNPGSCVEEVTFVCFDVDQYNLYEKLLATNQPQQQHPAP